MAADVAVSEGQISFRTMRRFEDMNEGVIWEYIQRAGCGSFVLSSLHGDLICRQGPLGGLTPPKRVFSNAYSSYSLQFKNHLP